MAAAEAAERSNLEALTFAAWQIRTAVLTPHLKQGKRLPNFGPYLRSLGLARKPAAAPSGDEAEAASRRAAQAVAEAFKRGVRKTTTLPRV